MRHIWLLCSALLPFSIAAPTPPTDGLQFHNEAARQKNLPMVELPYGAHQAAKYDEKADIYIFRNIRFAAPPTGDLRFAKPAQPQSTPGIQTGAKGGTCPQFLPTRIIIQATNGISGTLLAELSKLFDIGKWLGGGPTNEDCLFLDVYVPGDAMRKHITLPVVNWIYGGAFVVGNKEKHYNGTALIQAADNGVIYVAGNYRLGAFGWLAGSSVEEDKSAVPNAGLYDQRAVLEWIQQNIAKFGGNPEDVTVMGESAGGSSIMHHLTAFGGTQDPLFRRAIIQSPAFYPAVWDRNGVVQKNFEELTKAAGCKDKGVDCLRSKSMSVINKAQQAVVNNVPDGSFGFGPSPDGAWVRQLPQIELLTGNYYKNISSMIVSHMTHEADNFITTDPKRSSDAAFMSLINQHFNNNTDVSRALQVRLPLAKFQTARDRMLRYAQDAVFVCNTRYLSSAYKGKTYNFVMEGVHGRDVFANFYSPGGLAERVLKDSIGSSQAVKYQRYITSMLRSGDPNKYRASGTPEWPKAEVGPEITPTLRIDEKEFSLLGDPANSAVECDIWAELFAAVTNGGGYAPANGKLETHLGELTPNETSSAKPESATIAEAAPPVVPTSSRPSP